MRVTDSYTTTSTHAERINKQRIKAAVLQEQLASGKRINRPSDDPTGLESVIRLRTSQTEVKQFQRNTQAAENKLIASDDALNSFGTMLEKVRSILSQGLSDTTPQSAKNALAIELDGLRERILAVANTKYGDEYLFGGTRQNTPPFDPTTAAPAAAPTSVHYVQLEPGANAVSVGVTAESVFSDATGTIFTDLTTAAAALRGTGNEAVDRATLLNSVDRIKIYSDQTSIAQARVGVNMNLTQSIKEKLNLDSFTFDDRAAQIEGADFVETATQLNETERILEATLQVTAKGRRSLFDYL
jgi:flagellar hook-associated protein 3 FlgL